MSVSTLFWLVLSLCLFTSNLLCRELCRVCWPRFSSNLTPDLSFNLSLQHLTCSLVRLWWFLVFFSYFAFVLIFILPPLSRTQEDLLVEAIFSGSTICRWMPKLILWPGRHWLRSDYCFGEFRRGGENKSTVVTPRLCVLFLFKPSHSFSIFCFQRTPRAILFIHTGAQVVCETSLMFSRAFLVFIRRHWRRYCCRHQRGSVCFPLSFAVDSDAFFSLVRLYWFSIDCLKIVIFALS